jgi:hypothetical protein
MNRYIIRACYYTLDGRTTGTLSWVRKHHLRDALYGICTVTNDRADASRLDKRDADRYMASFVGTEVVQRVVEEA